MERLRNLCAVGVVVIGMIAGLSASVGGRQTDEGSIMLTVHACPEGMTVETLVEADCPGSAGEFDVEISFLEGLATPLTVADSDFGADCCVYGWNVPVGHDPFPATFGIRVTKVPEGYKTYDIRGDAVV